MSLVEYGITVVLVAEVREPDFAITSVAQALGLTGQETVPSVRRSTARRNFRRFG